MSAAAAAVPADAAPKKGKKKLIVIVLAALVLLLAALGGGALWLLSQSAAHDDEDDDVAAQADGHPARDPRVVPTFVPLETFTVNLADRDGERYAQIGVTLELDTPKAADQIKAYLPAIRNNILMLLAHKTAAELLQREGKVRLAAEIRRETLRPLGYELAADADDAADGRAAKKARRAPDAPAPVRQVHFSNFIIQ